MPTDHLLFFILAGWLLNLTPGPDVLYIVSHALKSGARAGIVAGFGITAGCFVHIAAAGLGVGALLATSAMAFTVLKWIGAGYLVWMGARMLIARAPTTGGVLAAAQAAPHAAMPLRRIFLGGFWSNVLNPKVAIFFLAFVPQFIAPGAENKALALVLLGVLFNINSIPFNIAWALAAAWMARRVGVVQRGLHWLDRVAGAMFIGFGTKLALTESPSA